ncbi:hypothetical protein [Undibacterium squillarum]|uniref:hypothetical protein n=1 Tax=Undibacterium squillarum TaxID=1131567 RepID=UPI0035B18C6E
MKKNQLIISIAAAVLSSGCAFTPSYQVPKGYPVAKLNLDSSGSKWICVSGQRQQLIPDTTGYAEIAAGNRITIGISYSGAQYGSVNLSCNPRSSIIPKEGQAYFIDFQVEASWCTAILFKEDPAKRTGLSIEPTLAPSSECEAR